MMSQVQTDAPLHFNKPFILVTRIGNNEGNDKYHNPYQRYYEFDAMNELFKCASQFGTINHRDEKPISALRIITGPPIAYGNHNEEFNRIPSKADYFNDFPTALDEYRKGIRRDV